MPGTASGDESGTDGTPDLTDFQLEVARLFFSLPASKGFLLAGGAALLAQHLTTRPTEDLDFFTSPEVGHVPAARDAPRGGRPVPPPHPPRLVGVHGTDNAGGGHDSRVGDEGPDRDDRDPDPRGGDGPLISRWPPDVTLMARAGRDYGVCSAP